MDEKLRWMRNLTYQPKLVTRSMERSIMRETINSSKYTNTYVENNPELRARLCKYRLNINNRIRMYKVWQGGDHDPIWWTFLPSNIILLPELKEFPDDYLRAVEPENLSTENSSLFSQGGKVADSRRNSNLPDWTWVLITWVYLN